MPQASKQFTYSVGQSGRSALSQAAAALLNSKAWRKASKAFLAMNPMCAECENKGKDTLAVQTDHVKPHRGDPEIFWDESNWQPLCASCGGAKSARGE
jgi:5-methylcytosine-specific restriction enzyme A